MFSCTVHQCSPAVYLDVPREKTLAKVTKIEMFLAEFSGPESLFASRRAVAHSWQYASRQIEHWAALMDRLDGDRSRDIGSGYKVDVVITWDNGHSYHGRLCINRFHLAGYFMGRDFHERTLRIASMSLFGPEVTRSARAMGLTCDWGM